MENIDIFNKYTAICLGQLYKSFPVPMELSAETIADQVIDIDKSWELDHTMAVVNNIDESSDEYPKKRTEIFRKHKIFIDATVNWLTECRYIQKSKTDSDSTGPLYVLSPKGLEVLSAIPDSLQTETFGERLIEATDNVAGEAGKAVISETVGQIIGAAFKAMTN